MKWFGHEDWGAPICRETPRAETPVGHACSRCNDPIARSDQGLLIPHIDGTPEEPSVEERPMHLECFLLNVGVIKVVHILYEGRALCGLPGIPREWPEGHRWVRKEERNRATCSGCKRGAADA
jgi:hypothetical protein